MFKIITAFRASENGIDVIEYPVGEVDSLPKTALAYGLKSGFVKKATAKKPKKTTKKADNKAD